MKDLKISHDQFISIYENALSENECKNIIKLFEEGLNNKVDMYGGKQFYKDKMERYDYQKVYKSNDTSNLIVLKVNEILTKCIQLYADEFWVVKQLGASALDFKIQKTPPRGGFHIWHCEQINGYSKRVLGWTIYLNNVPEGEGETEFLWQGIRVKPKAGTVSIFPAAFTHTHRGNPVYSCNKYIATGWYTLNE